MKKFVKISLIALGSLILLVVIGAGIGWYWLSSTFLDFEGDYAEKTDFQTLTVDGYSFIDRNGNGKLDIYEDDRKTTAERVEDLMSKMTTDEKIHLLKGSGMASGAGMTEPGEGIPGAVGTIVPTPRLGIPTIYLSDGPAGLRINPSREGEDRTYYCTAFPIGTLLASTWNDSLVKEVGSAMGNEALEYGIDVILGPGANIHRHPLCGRNFEYYSEDPVLTGNIAAAMVNGIESEGIGTSVKHFVVNNQETNRNRNDAQVSERALREIYLKGFEIVVKQSQPKTIMSSYNLVNGRYVAESEDLLTDILRDDWGFEGLVMSDWFGGQDAVAMVNAGNDLLEPGTKKQWKALQEGYEEGILTEASIDKSVRRILTLIIDSKKMENYQYGNNPDLELHARITRRAASEGMVLLKNDGTLPLKGNMNVALFGVTSFDFIAGGTGSGDVNEAYTVSLEEGLKNAGFRINEASAKAYYKHRDQNPDQFVKPEGIDAMFNPYTPPPIPYTDEDYKKIEADSEIAIITIGRNSGEGGDRTEADDFLLRADELDLIEKVCTGFHEAGKKVVVVLNIGGVIETASWKQQPDAILLAWQGGQEGGNSVADILRGQVNPSGKLPMTFPVNLDDHWSHANFPEGGQTMSMTDFLSGSERKPEEEMIRNIDYTVYEEGVFVGYRHFDRENKEVSFPFGFGLSYTTFEYSDLNAEVVGDSVRLLVSVTNVGAMAGKEVVEVYTSGTDSQIERPVQELKAYAKTDIISPGSSATVTLSFPVADLAYWDETTSGWQLEKGVYQIRVGSSSRDIRIATEMEI